MADRMIPQTYTVERAIEMVERVDRLTIGRRNRMDRDYERQRGDPYNTNIDSEGNTAGTDFRSFTSNEAGAFVRKIVSVLSSAQLVLQVPYGSAQRAQRGLYDLKERFAFGCLDQADDLLADLIEIGLVDQLCWFAPVRGWLTVRALLMNQDDSTTIASARCWDPRNVYWEVGPRGLLWAAHRTARPAREVLAEYPRASLNVRDDDEPVVVYDFYTPTKNGTLTEGGMLKEWEVHGSPRVPVVVVPVPTQPQIWAQVGAAFMTGQPDSLDDYGESILAPNRNLYDQLNEAMSIVLELMSKAREPSSIVYTDEEDTEMEDDPNVRGGVHYLGAQDKFQQLAPPDITKAAVQFVASITGMLQRGAINYSSYGSIDFPMSGFAMTQLNQQLLTVVEPEAKAVARALRGVCDLWVDQYVTGGFNPMHIRGFGRNKDYMQVDVQPEQLRDLPPYKVTLYPQLPQDDIARLGAAQAARQGATPFLPKRWLWENFLKLPDATLIDNQLKAELAESASPAALALTLARASFEEGEIEQAKIYIDIYIKAMVQSSMGAVQPPGGGAGGGPMPPGLPAGGPMGEPPGLPANVLPFIQQMGGPGGPPNPPTGEEGRFNLPRQTSGPPQ